MKTIKTYYEMIDGKEIKVTRFDSNKSKSNSIVKSKGKRPFTSRTPVTTGVSSIYNSNIKLIAQTKKDGRSSNRMTESRGRDWN